MTAKTILAIDQGTTSTRAILFAQNGDVLDVQQKELTLYYPDNGWVEQDAYDIWQDTISVCHKLLKKLGGAAANIAAVGITNQRETTVLWDRHTGEPVYNAIVWQDRRTAELCKNLKAQGHEARIISKTGLLLDPYFSATKIAWILDNVDGVRERAERGDIAFGTVESYLLWKLTNGRVHASDVTNASRTMLYNIVQQKWDEELLSLFNIPSSILPEVRDNASGFGVIDAAHFGGGKLSVMGMAGDQQAALIGQSCFQEGMVKSTYGTGCFALMNIGAVFKESQNRLLTTAAYRLDGKMSYAVEGSIFVAGAAVQFLRDNLRFFSNSAQSEVLAKSVNDTNGVYFVPAFTGLGAPYWDPHARAVISGLTRESNQAHITRAALEAQAYQTYDLLGAMERDTDKTLEVIRIDGGLAANDFVCQFLADILNVRIEVPKVIETTAWGAACLAGLQAGLFKGLDDIAQGWGAARSYTPSLDAQKRSALLKGWSKSVEMVLSDR